jgi:hypothetical protein
MLKDVASDIFLQKVLSRFFASRRHAIGEQDGINSPHAGCGNAIEFKQAIAHPPKIAERAEGGLASQILFKLMDRYAYRAWSVAPIASAYSH